MNKEYASYEESEETYQFLLENSKKVLADFYYKNELTDGFRGNNKDELINKIEVLKEEINNNPNQPNIASTYYNLASYMVDLQNFDEGKKYFEKSALQSTNISADAYFALSCIKIRLGEGATKELNNAIQLYEQEKNEFASFARALLSCQESDYNVEKSFVIVGQKRNGQFTIQMNQEGGHSFAEIDIFISQIKDFLQREVKFVNLKEKTNGNFKLKVVSITPLPKSNNGFIYPDCYSHIFSCEISGFNYIEVNRSINHFYNDFTNNM